MKTKWGLHDVCDVYRANAKSISERTISKAIKNNEFPEWSKPLYGEGGRFTPQIYDKKFIRWFGETYEIAEVKIPAYLQ